MTTPNPETIKLVKDYPRPSPVFTVARVPNTNRCYFGSADFQVSEADLKAEKFEPTPLYSHGSYVTSLVLAGTRLVSGGYDGKLIWWETASRQQIRTVDAHSRWIRKVVASPDGRTIASVADDMIARIWDTETGKLVHELKGHAAKTPHHFSSMLYVAAYSPDGHFLATGDKIGQIIIWDTRTGQEVSRLEAPVMYTWDKVQRLHSIGGIRSLAFSPDGRLLAVGGMGKVGNIDHLDGKARIEVFDWQAKSRLIEYESDAYKGLVNQLAFAPDGSWLAAAGGGTLGFFIFLDVAKKKLLKEDKAPMHVHGYTMTADGREFVMVGYQKIAWYRLEG